MEIIECKKCGQRSVSDRGKTWWTCSCNDTESVYKFFPPLEIQEVQQRVDENDGDIEGHPV